MPLNANSVGITDVKANGVAMNEVKVNGVTVWTRNLNLLSDAASAYTVTPSGATSTSFTKNASGQFVMTFSTPGWDGDFNLYVKRKTAIDVTRYSKLTMGGAISDKSGNRRYYVNIYRASDNALLTREEIKSTTGSFSISISLASINTSCYIEIWGWDTVANKTHTLTISNFQLVV